MNRQINRLPIEIIYHILSYSYKPQPVHLLEDIISYVRTKREIITIFHHRYNNTLTMDMNSINYHFTFHIQCFLTGLPNTYEYCKNKMEEVCKRLFIWNRLLALHKININTRFSHRVLWGLLTEKEREQFVEIQRKMDMERMP